MTSGFTAIAAISNNGVIGQGSSIPWHLPEDFKWFKRTTMGHTLVMGRKTFESIGRPLPGRITIVLSRSGFTHSNVAVCRSLDDIAPAPAPHKIFICGGGEVYREALPRCQELLITHVHRDVQGDIYFPDFLGEFAPIETILVTPEFSIIRYQRRVTAKESA